MTRRHTHIRLSEEERKALSSFMQDLVIRQPRDWRRMRLRAQAIWFSSPDHKPSDAGPKGLTVDQLCRQLSVSKPSVRRWFAAYRARGINGLWSLSRKDL